MDPDEMALEERKLRLQKWQGWAQALAPLAAVGVLAVTFYGTVNASHLNAETASRASQLEAAQVVAETGERLCVPQLGGHDPLLKAAPVEGLDLASFCADFLDRPPSLAVQKELIAQLVEHPNERATTVAMWRAVYVDDAWLDAISEAAGP